MPLLGCTYTGDAVALLCEALGSEHCTLHTLKLSSSRMRPAEASPNPSPSPSPSPNPSPSPSPNP